MWHVYMMECLAIKGTRELTQATTWMNLENILSERSHLQKTTYRMVLFM